MRVSTNIILGVSGGIAAYKSADLVRRLRERDMEVRVVMTDAACEFVTPLTFQAVSGNPVHRALFDEAAEAAMGHIELARWADLVLIAPATADFIATLAQGRADSLLSTLCLATTAKLVVAPAMNQHMWANAATQENVVRLRHRQVEILGPASGEQACLDVGVGRMLEPLEIAARIQTLCEPGRLSNVTVLVTAGPTQEAIDPVRYLSNHSSGKMGYALATAAVEAGANVTLVSGPTSLPTPGGVQTRGVTSAAEMYADVMALEPNHDIFIGAAAVADYRPVEVQDSKIKKHSDLLTLHLARTSDILADVAALPKPPFTVGFAAETDNLKVNALAKLERKSLDLIAANQVGQAGLGFGGDHNALDVYWQGGSVSLPRAPKIHIARCLMAVVADRYHAQSST